MGKTFSARPPPSEIKFENGVFRRWPIRFSAYFLCARLGRTYNMIYNTGYQHDLRKLKNHRLFELSVQSIIGATERRAAVDKSCFLILSATCLHLASSRSGLFCTKNVDFDAALGTMYQIGFPCTKSGGHHGLDLYTQAKEWRQQLPCARASDARRNLLS